MRQLSVVVAFLAFTCPVWSQTASVGQNTDEEQAVIAAARGRAAAFVAGDCQGWMAYVDEHFRDIEGNGSTGAERLVKECQQARNLPDYKMERILSDFHLQMITNAIAVLDYRYEVKEHFGEILLTDPHRQIDTYEKRQGKWIAMLAVSAIEVTDPPVASIAPSSLDAFTGQYTWVGTRMVDTITRKGNQLFIQTTGDLDPTELLPESPDTFFIRGQLARLAFVRDKSGAVIGEHAYSPSDHQGYQAKKIR